MPDIDYIEPGQLGSNQSVPYTVAPDDMHENGLPYGAWCKCGKCGHVDRSTFAFDYYGSAGEVLKCERCAQAGMRKPTGETNLTREDEMADQDQPADQQSQSDDHLPDLRGGQIWHQSEFPNRNHFLAYLSGDLWCLLTSPELGGFIAQHDYDGHWLWSGACLRKWLIENGYECRETFRDQYKRTCEQLYAAIPSENQHEPKGRP